MTRILVVCAMIAFCSCSGNRADSVYVNGQFWTGDVSNPVATVVAIKDCKIIYVGDDADLYGVSE